MKWKCKRCDVIFTEERRMAWKNGEINCPCNCTVSPSPWEPIPVVEIGFEKVEIKARPTKLEGTWKVELDPEVKMWYNCPETKWERFCHWFKYLFIKGKRKKL